MPPLQFPLRPKAKYTKIFFFSVIFTLSAVFIFNQAIPQPFFPALWVVSISSSPTSFEGDDGTISTLGAGTVSAGCGVDSDLLLDDPRSFGFYAAGLWYGRLIGFLILGVSYRISPAFDPIFPVVPDHFRYAVFFHALSVNEICFLDFLLSSSDFESFF